MKTQIIETFSLNELVQAGYKEKDREWYLGDARWPSHRISKNFEHLLGKKLVLKGLDPDRGSRMFLVESFGEDFYLPASLVKTKLKKVKTSKILVGDRAAKFSGYGFTFPYSSDNLGIDEARKVAKWILRVTK